MRAERGGKIRCAKCLEYRPADEFRGTDLRPTLSHCELCRVQELYAREMRGAGKLLTKLARRRLDIDRAKAQRMRVDARERAWEFSAKSAANDR